jgi:hypothetical protein
LLLLWTVGASLLLVELGVRVYFSVRVGPDVMLWGTSWHRDRARQQFMRGQNVFEHENVQSGYSKYFPGQERVDVDHTGTPFAVEINLQGFRGKDYEFHKPPTTLRVVALGASSTFGFGNRENETYPFALERLLKERLEGAPCGDYEMAEVVNLGIPHLDSLEVAELFAAEGQAYQPDAVTIYSGYNNTRGLGQSSIPKSWSRYLLAVNFVRVAKQQSASVSELQLVAEQDPRTRAFVAGLDRILDIARQHQIAVLPITQQVRALPTETILERHLGYNQEMDVLERKLQVDGQLSLLEAKVLIHRSLTRALHRWADDNDLELIDGIELLDGHRDLLATYVHLTPLANELLALAISDGLARQFGCPQLATTVPDGVPPALEVPYSSPESATSRRSPAG